MSRFDSPEVPPAQRTRVMILYTHPLLGEGIARLLASEPGLQVIPVPAGEAELVQQTLALAPEVIIFERSQPDRAVEILESVPGALLIDVGIDPGPTFTYHREEIPGRPEGILQLIRTVQPATPAAGAVARPMNDLRAEDPASDVRPSRGPSGTPMLPARATARS